ncbi:MAG: hypothetical protein RI973_1879, partial [Bacteroidota bacterium]
MLVSCTDQTVSISPCNLKQLPGHTLEHPKVVSKIGLLLKLIPPVPIGLRNGFTTDFRSAVNPP